MLFRSESAGGQQGGAWRAAPGHADGDGQPGCDILESGAMGSGGRAGGESAGGQQGGAWRAAPGHADGDGQPGCDISESGAMGSGGRAAGESAGGQQGGAWRAAPGHADGDGQPGVHEREPLTHSTIRFLDPMLLLLFVVSKPHLSSPIYSTI